MTQEELLDTIEWASRIGTNFLRLHHKDLTHLPSAIGKLINLITLDLDSNKIESLPEEIGNLVNLKTLYLRKNRLSTLPTEITKLQKLKYIYLEYNEFVRVPEELIYLHENGRLERIGFYGNPITPLSGNDTRASAFVYDYKKNIKPWLVTK